MTRHLVFLFTIFCSTAFYSYSQKIFNRQDTLRGSLSQERACFDVTYYNLALTIDIDNKSFRGSNDIFFTVLSNTSKIQLDLFSNLIIDSIYLGKTKLVYEREGNTFFVFFQNELVKNETYAVRVYYEGNPIIAKKAPWDGGWVFAQDSLKRPWVGVACEGIGASLWWPMKDHLSDEPDSMRMHYTVPSHLTAVGNGVLESTSTEDNLKTFNWKVNYPINSYNVTCNIANYVHLKDSHLQQNKDTLALDYYVLDYNKEKALKHFKQVKPMLTCYENYFGAYPFLKDGYAMVETPYWGMEHQGAIAYGNDYTNKIIDFDYIIIHETGHEWWGNNLSVSDHAEMWIHESFTTYAENLLVEYFYGYDMSIRYLNLNKPLIKNESPIVGPTGVNYEGWEDSDMYYKGAWILHTFRNVLNNDSLWFSILKGMQQDLTIKTVKTSDIIEYINKSASTDYTWFFNQYLYNAQPPILEFYIEKRKKNILLHYKWINTQQDFKMPIPIKLKSGKLIRVIPTLEFKVLGLKNKDYNKDFFVQNFNYYLIQNSKK